MHPLISRVLKGSVVVTASLVLTYAFRFAKNIILAHILTKFDYGACVALITVATSAQLLTDFGFDKLLVQERSVAVETLQPVLTALNVLRTSFAGLLLLAIAKPLAFMFGASNATGAFALLAVGVFLQGFSHLDPIRVQRLHRFLPIAGQNVAISAVDFVVALTCAYLFRSYFAVPIAFVASTAAGLLVSRLVAEERFAIRWDAEIVRRAWTFGAPLVVSGIVILLASQADRVLVGAALGLPVLAVYGAAMTIIATPSAFVSNVAITVSLPALSEASDKTAFAKRFRYAGVIITFFAGIIYIPVVFLGQPLITRVFGASYNPGFNLIWVMVLGQTASLVRIWSNIGALALGDSKNVVASNVPRASGILLALAAIHFGAGLMGIAVSFAFGEIIALIAAFWHLVHRRPHLLLGIFPLVGILCTTILLAGETGYHIQGYVLGSAAASFAFICLLAMAFLTVSAESRGLVQMLMGQAAGWRNHARARAQ